MGLITGLRAKINKGSETEFFKCESHDGKKSIPEGRAFLYGRLVPLYNQVTCSRHVLIDFDTSLTLVVVLRQIGVGGEFFKDIFDCEIAKKNTAEILWYGLRTLLWFTYLCYKLLSLPSLQRVCHVMLQSIIYSRSQAKEVGRQKERKEALWVRLAE